MFKDQISRLMLHHHLNANGGDPPADPPEGKEDPPKEDPPVDPPVVVVDPKEEARLKYEERTGKKSAVDELSARMDGIDTLVQSIDDKLSILDKLKVNLEDKKQGGRPKNEENAVLDAIQVMADRVVSFESNIKGEIEGMKQAQETDRKASVRRSTLQDIGASPKFIQLAESGVVNVDPIINNFDALYSVVDSLGGFVKTTRDGSGNGEIITAADGTTRSVPHRDADLDTNAIHADRGLGARKEQEIVALDKEIDKILGDGKALLKEGGADDPLLKVINLADKRHAITNPYDFG